MKKGAWKRKLGLYHRETRVWEILERAEFRRKKTRDNGLVCETYLKNRGGL